MHKYQKINYYIDIFCIFASDSKNTNEKKLKKLYLDKCSSGLLLPKSFLNASSIKIFYVFIYFLSIGFSTQMSAQESIITGLENIHISDGAAIITEDAEENITVVTAQSVVTYSKRDKSNFDIPKVVKSNEKTKNSKKNVVRKYKAVSENTFVYNKDTHSKNSFFYSNNIERQGVTNSSHYKDVLLPSKINRIVSLKYFQIKENVLYNFYHPKKVNNSLFARPPPNFI